MARSPSAGKEPSPPQEGGKEPVRLVRLRVRRDRRESALVSPILMAMSLLQATCLSHFSVYRNATKTKRKVYATRCHDGSQCTQNPKAVEAMRKVYYNDDNIMISVLPMCILCMIFATRVYGVAKGP